MSVTYHSVATNWKEKWDELDELDKLAVPMLRGNWGCADQERMRSLSSQRGWAAVKARQAWSRHSGMVWLIWRICPPFLANGAVLESCRVLSLAGEAKGARRA